MLGVNLSHNKNLEQDKTFWEHIIKIENILKLLRTRQLILEGRITVFKSLAISKFKYLLLITKLHSNTTDFLYKIQKNFIWQGKTAKIKHSTLCKCYERGSIKMLVCKKNCSLVKNFFDDDCHYWKVITLFLMGKNLGKNFKFHSNIDVHNGILTKFP